MRPHLSLKFTLAWALSLAALGCGGGSEQSPASGYQVEGADLSNQYTETMEDAGEALAETAEVASETAVEISEPIPAETQKFSEELEIMLHTTSPEDVMMRLTQALEEFTQEIEGGHWSADDRRVIVTSLDVIYDTAGELHEVYMSEANPLAMEQLDDLMKETFSLQEQLLEGHAAEPMQN